MKPKSKTQVSVKEENSARGQIEYLQFILQGIAERGNKRAKDSIPNFGKTYKEVVEDSYIPTLNRIVKAGLGEVPIEDQEQLEFLMRRLGLADRGQLRAVRMFPADRHYWASLVVLKLTEVQ